MAIAFVQPHILYAWRGPSLLIVTTEGRCAADQPLSGYYFREARFLHILQLAINGEAPWLCEAASIDTDRLDFNFVYPEIKTPGGGGTGQSGDEEVINAQGLPERALAIQLSYRTGIAALDVTLIVENRSRRTVAFTLSWDVGADYADILEAQSGSREQQAAVDVSASGDAVVWTYRHEDLAYRTQLHHDGRWQFRDGRLAADVRLAAQQRETISLRIEPRTSRHDIDSAGAEERAHALEQWRAAMTRVEVPGNRVFERAFANNVRDIASFPLLEGERDEWLSMQAGMPLYPAFFGRDGVTAGWQGALLDRGDSLDAALCKLTRLQSDRFDDWRDEQPGRIPYQMRSGPLALLNKNPYAAYYADYASPLMFVISLANLWAWTGDRRRVAPHWDAARRIMEWAREHGDMDRDGYLEYQTRSSMGTKNQGWKDSGDAIIYEDGSPVRPPIATCELQGYWYLAQELMALLSWVMGARDDAAGYRASAKDLKARFNRDWWMDDEHCVALALDPAKRQVRAVTSNAGHCLACGIVEAERIPALVGRLFAPDMFSGWGIRTLSTEHAFYDPLSYHRGTVWAVEQATVIFGLRRFGFDARALDLTRALFDLSQLYPEDRIPECVGGYARGERPTPGAYPRANTPQLWNATAFPLALQTMLGLLPVAAIDTLIIDPALPDWIPELVVRDLRIGNAKVTLRCWRDADGTSRWKVLHQQGTLRVVRQPAPESLSAGWLERIGALLQSMAP